MKKIFWLTLISAFYLSCGQQHASQDSKVKGIGEICYNYAVWGRPFVVFYTGAQKQAEVAKFVANCRGNGVAVELHSNPNPSDLLNYAREIALNKLAEDLNFIPDLLLPDYAKLNVSPNGRWAYVYKL